MLNKLFGKKDTQVSFKVCKKEYDSPELTSLSQWLKKEGWSTEEKSYYVVGSQEVITYKITKGKNIAYLVYETYEGVSLFTSAENEHFFNEIKEDA